VSGQTAILDGLGQFEMRRRLQKHRVRANEWNTWMVYPVAVRFGIDQLNANVLIIVILFIHNGLQ
jgi:hypothetical protein